MVCGVERHGKSLSGQLFFVCENDDREESSTKSLGGMTRPKDEMGSQIVSSESDISHPILVYLSRNNNSQAQARRFPALTAPEPDFPVFFGSKWDPLTSAWRQGGTSLERLAELPTGGLSSPETNFKVGLLPFFFMQLLLSHMFLSFMVRTSPLIVIGSASYCVWGERERERERERDTETDGSDVTIVALKLAMSLHFPLPKIRTIGDEFTLPLPKIRNEFTLSVAKKLRTLCSNSLEWREPRDEWSKTQDKWSNPAQS